jgi:mRNA interferase MazF
MLKEFDRWNTSKKAIDRTEKPVNFHEREIWLCSVGVNVGSEQDSYSKDFSRPVVIAKRFTEKIFWGIPLTTKVRSGQFRIRFYMNGIQNDMLVWHTRSFDRKRLIRKVGTVPDEAFQTFEKIIAALFLQKTKTPCGAFSEAEASGCTISIADEISMSNEMTKLLEKRELTA